ncbi:MAG: type II toxin-antitoxin system MqsA family antitoxin [Syntrophales bacterium]|nr:type II toxin-antitoxin system MqsA family antitoxin [Syntrophales bacterium]
MKCVFCGGETKPMLVTFSYEEGNRYFFVEHVPAEVCARCGEKTYSPDVTDELLEFAKNKFKPVKKLEVPVFDFAESC